MNNDQRAELHSEIYNYFTWLRTQVKEEGGKVGGKKSIGGISSDALKEVLRSLSEAYNVERVRRKLVSKLGIVGGGWWIILHLICA